MQLNLVQYIQQRLAKETCASELDVILSTQPVNAINAVGRDLLQSFLSEQNVKNAHKIQFLGMSKTKAREKCLALLGQHQGAAEHLTSLRMKAVTPQWSPALEHQMHAIRSCKQLLLSETEWDQTFKTLNLCITMDQLLVLLTDPEWRRNVKMDVHYIGPACNVREANLFKSPVNISTRFSQHSIKYLPSEVLVLQKEASVVLDFQTLEIKRVLPALAIDLARVKSIASVPGTSTLIVLQNRVQHVSHKQNKKQEQEQEQDLSKNENGQHSLTIVELQDDAWRIHPASIVVNLDNPTFVDCVIGCEATLFVQVSERNTLTGGFTEFETYTLSTDWKEKQPNNTETELAEELDEKRLRHAKDLDFRDHGSVISCKSSNVGSLVLFDDIPLLETEDYLVAALGCPQNFVTVSACGSVARYENGEVLRKTLNNANHFATLFCIE